MQFSNTQKQRWATPFVTLVAIAICAVWLGAAATAEASADLTRYVALGDSSATGSGLGVAGPDIPLNCHQTQNGYPSLAAAQLNVQSFVSAACASAAINDFSTTQDLSPSGIAQPQFNALNGSETIVSMTIGDNDAGYGWVADACLKNLFPDDFACGEYHGHALPELSQNVSWQLADAIDFIHRRSPNAAVFVVGYPRIVPPDGSGCTDRIDVSSENAASFDAWEKMILAVEKDIAAAHGAVFVDVYSASTGHDACQAEAARWTNPKQAATTAGWEFHPTLAGSAAMANMLVEAIRNWTPRPKPVLDAPPQSVALNFHAKHLHAVAARAKPIIRKRPKKHGAKLGLTLVDAGPVKFYVDRAKSGRVRNGKCRSMSRHAGRGRKHCTRYLRAATPVTIDLAAGTSRLYVTGRSGKKRLRAGKYRIRAVAGKSAAKTRTFSIRR